MTEVDEGQFMKVKISARKAGSAQNGAFREVSREEP